MLIFPHPFDSSLPYLRLLQNGFRIKGFSSNSDFILIFVRNDKQFLSFSRRDHFRGELFSKKKARNLLTCNSFTWERGQPQKWRLSPGRGLTSEKLAEIET